MNKNNSKHIKETGEASAGVGSLLPSSESYSEPIETTDPFAKKDRMARTPPRARTFSLPSVDLGDDTQKEASKKRRREEEETAVNNKEYKNKEENFKKVLDDMSTKIKRLECLIRKSYKPKTEIRETTSTLVMLIEKLCPEKFSFQEISECIRNKNEEDRIKYWKEKFIIEHQVEQDRLREENRELRQQIQVMETEKCTQCINAGLRKQKIKNIKTSDSYEEFQKITEEDWNDEIFNNRVFKQGNVWESPTNWDIILPCNKRIESKFIEVAKAVEHFGGRDGLAKQDKKVGEVALMAHSIGFPDNKGNIIQDTRWIYYPILSEETSECNNKDGDLFRSLNEIKCQAVNQKRTKLVIPQIEGVTGHIITRMLEFLFVDTNIQIAICKPHPVNRVTRVGDVNKKQSSRPPKAKINRDTIIVQMKDKSYADLLKTVKSAVKPNEVGVEIEDMKSTKNGDLLLTIQNGADKAEVLKRELTEKVPGASASILSRKKVLHLKDMDEVTHEDEIVDAISKTINVNKGDFEVRALRPSYGNKQNATIIMKDSDADKLIEVANVKIGWTRCRVIERKNDPRCYRCWEHGHIKSQCKGPDREALCMKCAKEGHSANKCPNKAFCLLCNQEGHQSYSRKCMKILATQNENITDQHQ